MLEDVQCDREIERSLLEGKPFGGAGDDSGVFAAERVDAHHRVGVLLEDGEEGARSAPHVQRGGGSPFDVAFEKPANECAPAGEPEVGSLELRDSRQTIGSES